MNTPVRTTTLVNLNALYPQVNAFSSLCKETDEPLVFEKMLFLDEHSDAADVVSAFDSDLGKTGKILKNIALFLNSTDESGVVQEITTGENNLKSLFGDRYNHEQRTVEVFGVKINRTMRDLPDDAWKELIYQKVFKAGLPTSVEHFSSYDEFKKHRTLMKTYSNESAPRLDDSLEKRLKHCHMETMLENQRDFHVFIMGKASKFSDFRHSLTERSRSEFDEKLIASRSLIDGVIKSSTYITNESIIQISPKHKKEIKALKIQNNELFFDALHKLIKENPYIMSVEIDQDTELLKVHDTLVELKDLTFDSDEPFILKFRKIGNYNASGLSIVTSAEGKNSISKQYGYSSRKLRIVAIDVESPSALAHELSHYRDINRTDHSRSAFIEFMREKMDIDALVSAVDNGSKYDARYYSSGDEIIARAGEIGFILNKFNYQDGEALSDFAARVALEESQRKPKGAIKYTMSLSESIEYYIGKNTFTKNIYFNMAEWKTEDISIVRDFTRSFFHKSSPEITARLKERLNSDEFKKIMSEHARRKRTVSVKRSSPPTDQEKVNAVFAKMAPGELEKTYSRAIGKGLLRDGEFGFAFAAGGARLFDGGGAKTSKGISWKTLYHIMEEMNLLANKVSENNMYYDALALNAMYSHIVLKSFSAKQHVGFTLESLNTQKTNNNDRPLLLAEKYQDLIISTKRLSTYLKEVSRGQQLTSDNEVSSISDVVVNFYLLSDAESKSKIPNFSNKSLAMLVDSIDTLHKKIVSLPAPELCPAPFRDMDILISNALLIQPKNYDPGIKQFCEGEALKQFLSLLKNKDNFIYYFERSYFKKNLGWDKNGAIIPGPFSREGAESLLLPFLKHIESNMSQYVESIFKKRMPHLEKDLTNYLSNVTKKTAPTEKLNFIYRCIMSELTKSIENKEEASALVHKSIKLALATSNVSKGLEEELNKKMSDRTKFKIKNEIANSALGKAINSIIFTDRTESNLSPPFIHAFRNLIEETLKKGVDNLRFESLNDCCEFISEQLLTMHKNVTPPPALINPGLKSVTPHLEGSKEQLSQWVNALVERYGNESHKIIAFVIERTLRGDIINDEPKALKMLMLNLAYTSHSVALPLVVSEKLTCCTTEIIENANNSITNTDKELESISLDLNGKNVDIENEIQLPESEPESFSHLPSDVHQEIEKLNIDIESPKNGVLGKSQQMKMF